MANPVPSEPDGSDLIGSKRELTRAVERSVADLDANDLVLVACSGGPDSLALAAVTAECAQRGIVRAGAIVVDHQLQEHSQDVAMAAGKQCVALGLDPVEVIEVNVAQGPGNSGLEAAARTVRRQALVQAAGRHGASAILVAHTLDDQAETVLLGLARGSGARSLAGMASEDGLWRRPLLSIRRTHVRAALESFGLRAYEDPHNVDDAFARVRVRRSALPALESDLGPGVTEALARSAALLRADNEALDEWARREAAVRLATSAKGMTVALVAAGIDLRTVPSAVRTRLLRTALLAAGVPGGSITSKHLRSVDALVGDWRGQGPVRLPGDIDARRESAKLVIYRAGPIRSTGV